MKVLYLTKRPDVPLPLAEGFINKQRKVQTMEQAVSDIKAALKERIVWANVPELGEQKFIVRDVRVLEDFAPVEKYPGMFMSFDRVQVLLLEGWQTPSLVWTDEESHAEEWAEEIPG